jgi:nucleoid-associated protein YgaU
LRFSICDLQLKIIAFHQSQIENCKSKMERIPLMRKDVKLAFAVGGILISVLIVYVMVVPGSDKRPDRQPVSLDEKSQAAAPSDKTAPPAATDKSDKPADAPKPADTVASASTGDKDKAPDAAPTTKPTDPFASAGGDKEDTWIMALNRGSVPMMTSAPPPGQPGAARTTAKSAKSARSAVASLPQMEAAAPVSTDDSAPTTRPVTNDTTPTANGVRTHTIAKGETISSIAQAVYGSPNYWPYIVRANPGMVAEKIRPGMTINLPPESEVKGAATNNTTVADTSGPKPDTTSPKLDTDKEYEVQSGDSLAKISMKLYGNSSKWQAIYDLNKDAIGDNPAKLKVRSVLKLPEPPTQKQS